MILLDPLERQVSQGLADLAGTNPPTYLDDILRRSDRMRQRPAWTSPGRWLPRGLVPQQRPAGTAMRSQTMIFTLRVAVVAALTIAIGIGTRPLWEPPSPNTPGAPSPSPSPSASGVPTHTVVLDGLFPREPNPDGLRLTLRAPQGRWRWSDLQPGIVAAVTGGDPTPGSSRSSTCRTPSRTRATTAMPGWTRSRRLPDPAWMT